MPRATQPATGVIVRDAHLQIDLRTVGYGKERLELLPTPANIKYAERLRNEILGKVERGTFAPSETNSGSRALVGSSNNITSDSMASERAIATRCC